MKLVSEVTNSVQALRYVQYLPPTLFSLFPTLPLLNPHSPPFLLLV